MKFQLSEDQQGIADGLKQMLKGLVTDESLKALAKEGAWFHERAWQTLAEAEMLGLAIPEAHGGLGLLHDGALPSGNSVMADTNLRVLLDRLALDLVGVDPQALFEICEGLRRELAGASASSQPFG